MRTALVYLTMTVLTVVFGIIVLVATMLGAPVAPGGFLERLPAVWARWTLRVAGVRIRVNNPQLIAHGEPRVYVGNHVSWFDVFALAAVLTRWRYMAKKELFRIPIFGPAVARVAGIFIDRQNRKAAFDAYAEAADRIRTGLSVIVFPEGTRGRSYALRPFKKGPFVLAITAGVPVVPVVVHGTREVQAKGERRVRPGLVDVTLLEPIPTAGLTYEDRDRLMRATWDRMAALLEERYGVHSSGSAIDPAPSAV